MESTRKLTIKYTAGAWALALSVVCTSFGRTEEWLYEFSGEPELPPIWEEYCTQGGQYDITDEGLVLRPRAPGAGNFAALRHNSRALEGDLSVRVQVRAVGRGVPWFMVYNPVCWNGYYVGFNRSQSKVTIVLYDGGRVPDSERQAPIEVFDNRAINLQLDVRGDNLTLRAWWDGEDPRVAVTVSVDDMTHRSGTVGIGCNIGEEGAYSVYSSVWICEGSDCVHPDDPLPPVSDFLRGDPNDDGQVNISDPIHTLNGLFAGGPAPGCLAATDVNGDGAVNISDPTYLLNHLFAGGPAPVSPFPDCGPGTLPIDASTCATPPKSCSE